MANLASDTIGPAWWCGKTFLVSQLALAVLLVSSSVSQATRIPGMGDIPNGFFFTTEMDLIKITMPMPRGETEAAPLAVFNLPRAYIYLTSHHSEKQVVELPSEIEADTIFIVLTYPAGEPYSVALARLNESFVAARRNGNTDLKSPSTQLRSVLTEGAISTSKPVAYDSAIFHPRDYEPYIGDYGTLKRHDTLGTSEVYFGKPGDLIRKIRCYRTPENAKPNFFCDYYTVLSSHVMAKVSFVDFRVNGGIRFAEERVRAFKQTVCRHMQCD
ncbi:hypothetical protein EOI86_05595 [Hwanghaeella grinnelliae]|uniref:Uncharacterized protein n=1 Tax=Hwanghaeella grinnelliae TaxID=2500179 RepID=A0A3S2ZBF9_9PROT|nr:hypothetical protein [Hwanghaeella grinnelliae]RVU38745.1 hypothetical protein EOI86_05595 [Hwanghaeella grinnelliae]